MTAIEVELSALRSIVRSLRNGGNDVESIGGSAPRSVDAGAMTGLVTSFLGEVTDNAATLCEGLNNAATAVQDSHDSYESADQDAASALEPPGARGG